MSYTLRVGMISDVHPIHSADILNTNCMFRTKKIFQIKLIPFSRWRWLLKQENGMKCPVSPGQGVGGGETPSVSEGAGEGPEGRWAASHTRTRVVISL